MVICIHVNPLGWYVSKGELLLQSELCKSFFNLAVPAFFALSGFLFYSGESRRSDKAAYGRSYFVKILKITITWNLFYLFAKDMIFSIATGTIRFDNAIETIRRFISSPGRFLFYGTYYHLWFLSALLLAVGMFLLLHRQSGRLFLAASAALFVLGLLGESRVSMGAAFRFPQHGAYFAPLIFGLGYECNKRKFTCNWQMLVLTGVASTLLFTYLSAVTQQSVTLTPLSFIPFCFGVLCFTSVELDLTGDILPKLGKLTLGVYVLHPFLILVYGEMADHFHFALPVAVKIAVIFTSTLLATRLARSFRPVQGVL